MRVLTRAAPYSMLNSIGNPYSWSPHVYPSSGASKNIGVAESIVATSSGTVARLDE